MLFTKKLSKWFQIESELSKAKAYPGLAFQVWCLIQLKKIGDVLSLIREKSKPGEKYSEYLEKGIELQKLYCKKNPDGTIFVSDSQAGPILHFEGQNKVLFDDGITALNTEFEAEIKAREDQIADYDKYVDSTNEEFEIKMLNPDHLPKKFFEENPDKSLSFLSVLMDLIDFKVEE